MTNLTLQDAINLIVHWPRPEGVRLFAIVEDDESQIWLQWQCATNGREAGDGLDLPAHWEEDDLIAILNTRAAGILATPARPDHVPPLTIAEIRRITRGGRAAK